MLIIIIFDILSVENENIKRETDVDFHHKPNFIPAKWTHLTYTVTQYSFDHNPLEQSYAENRQFRA